MPKWRLLRNLLTRGATSTSSVAASSSFSASATSPLVPSFLNGSSTGQFQAGARGISTALKEWKYEGQRSVLPLGLTAPEIAVDAFVAPNAVIAGQVFIQDKASVWYGVVIRGDLNRIKVGPWSSIGDKSVLHAAASSATGVSSETDIGKFCTIGGFCTLRSCVIEDYVIIGQRCIVMEGSIVEKHAWLASGTVVPPGRRIPAGEIWAGNPARFVRMVTDDEIALIPKLAEDILEVAQTHSEEFLPYGQAYLEVEKLFKAGQITA